MTWRPSSGGRIDFSSSSAASVAMRASSSSMRRSSARALRSLRVVQSQRWSSFSWSSSGPASRTYRRTAASVQPIA